MKNNLSVLLAKKQMKLSKLSEITGLSQSTLVAIRYNRSNPSIDTLQKIAKALNVTIDELLTVEE